jgi:MFS family permease
MAFRKSIPALALLFYSNLSILFVGMGLFPILPYYAAQFGASRSFIGIFFAIINASLAGGSLISGYLATRFNIRRLFILTGLLGVPSLILLGLARSLWQVVALTAAVWFIGGLLLSLISMFTGSVSTRENRGRNYSLISLTVPVGAVLGGAGVGNLITSAGYGFLFLMLGLLWLGLPLAGLLMLPEVKGVETASAPRPRKGYKPYSLSEPFAAVLLISLLSAVAISFARLGAPLAMQAFLYTPSEVSSSVVISGLVAIPVVMISGTLSDRISRSRSLILAYLSAAAGIIVLGLAGQLWHYWISASFVMISFCLNGALASAVAADVLPPQDLKRGLAWLSGAIPAVSVIAYAGTGVLTDLFGFQQLFLLVSILPIAAAGLMEFALQRCRRSLKRQLDLRPVIEPVLEPNLWDDNPYIRRCL